MKLRPGAGMSSPHRFPALTLACSAALLLAGLRLADLLPAPHLPRLSSLSPQTSPRQGQAQAAFSLPITSVPSVPSVASLPDLPHRVGNPDLDVAQENITLDDVSFLPIRVPLWPMASRLLVRASQRNLSLVDPRTDTPFWSGSAVSTAPVQFIYSCIAGTQTLSNEKGQVLWSDVPTPDLLFEKRSDGTARLSDRRGKTLWAGPLAGSVSAEIARSDRQGTLCTLNFSGIQLNGNNGFFTVIDRSAVGAGTDTNSEPRVLWSGTLPVQPVLLFRDNHQYLYLDRDRSESGTDRTAEINLIGETGTVTITDARQQILGTKTVEMLRIESIIHLLDTDKSVPAPVQYCVPQGALSKSGAVLLTYQNAQGRQVHKNNLVRDGDRQGLTNSGLLY